MGRLLAELLVNCAADEPAAPIRSAAGLHRAVVVLASSVGRHVPPFAREAAEAAEAPVQVEQAAERAAAQVLPSAAPF